MNFPKGFKRDKNIESLLCVCSLASFGCWFFVQNGGFLITSVLLMILTFPLQTRRWKRIKLEYYDDRK